LQENTVLSYNEMKNKKIPHWQLDVFDVLYQPISILL